MQEEMSPIDMLLDEDCVDNIVIYDELNNPVEFEQVAIIPLNDRIYPILKPVNPMDGLADDEALVFCIEETEDGDVLVIEDDQDTVDQVFEEYYMMFDEEELPQED